MTILRLNDRDERGYALELHANATIAQPVTLYNCAPIGSAGYTRTLEPGTPVELLEELHGGLCRIRYRADDEVGVLVDAEDVADDVRGDG